MTDTDTFFITRAPRTCLGSAPEHRKAPWRKLERQVEMLAQGIDAEPKHRHVQKRRVGQGDPVVRKECANIKFDFVAASCDASPVGYGMVEVSVFGAGPFSDEYWVRGQAVQPEGQSCGGNTARDINRVDRYAAGAADVNCRLHNLPSFRFASCADPLTRGTRSQPAQFLPQQRRNSSRGFA